MLASRATQNGRFEVCNGLLNIGCRIEVDNDLLIIRGRFDNCNGVLNIRGSAAVLLTIFPKPILE
jgi:hypothetical protein